MGIIKSILGSIKLTIALGFVIAILISAFLWDRSGSFNISEASTWLHVLAGIT